MEGYVVNNSTWKKDKDMEIDPNMTIKEWLEMDLDRCAWLILDSALKNIENKTYYDGGSPTLQQASRDFMESCDPEHPQWVAEVRALVEEHRPEGYESPFDKGNGLPIGGLSGPAGPRGPYG